MKHEQIINLIVERLQACTDESLLDLILALLIESGY
jgi:hypothetical protein